VKLQVAALQAAIDELSPPVAWRMVMLSEMHRLLALPDVAALILAPR